MSDPDDDFDYGEQREDGQYENHPTDDGEGEFIRPVRTAYVHEACDSVTSMPRDLAETYARNPSFYGKTFCAACGDYFPVGEGGEFVWESDRDEKVGT